MSSEEADGKWSSPWTDAQFGPLRARGNQGGMWSREENPFVFPEAKRSGAGSALYSFGGS